MPDIFSKITRSKIMSSIRSINTKPELQVRNHLFRNGFRYRTHISDLPGKPDIVLKKYQTAIQVRGCFWHNHKCKNGRMPSTRKRYWKKKLQKNVERDKVNDRKLRKMGWKVIVIWECAINNEKKFNTKMTSVKKRIEN